MALDTAGKQVAASVPPYRAFGGFRLLLALVVVVSHGAWIAEGTGLGGLLIGGRFGSAAVLTFFVLSGYVMSEAVTTFNSGRPRSFAVNRMLKIVPPFLAALVLSVAVHGIALQTGGLLQGIAFEGYSSVPKEMFTASNLLQNLAAIVPFAPLDMMRSWMGDRYLFVRYIWAVQVEMEFYAILFVLLLAQPMIGSRLGRGGRIACVAAAIALVMANQLLFRFSGSLQYAPYFALGALVYFHSPAMPQLRLPLVATCLLIGVHQLQFIFGVTPLAPGWFAPLSDPMKWRSSLLLAVLLIGFVALQGVRLPRGLARLDRRLGDLSYPIYLNHYTVLVAYAAWIPKQMSPTWGLLGVVAVAMVLAAVTQYLVERPMAAWRDRVRGQAILPPAEATIPPRRERMRGRRQAATELVGK
jgi:peptidoglycan/LPS O-acetylase OafA/YrhL